MDSSSQGPIAMDTNTSYEGQEEEKPQEGDKKPWGDLQNTNATPTPAEEQKDDSDVKMDDAQSDAHTEQVP